jgi:GxxExxY protein
MTLFTPPLTNIVIALARSVQNDIGNQHPKPVYFDAMLNAMRASRLLVHEHPLVILCINNKPISEHSPDFIVEGQETLVVNLLAAPSITQADVNCVQACLDALSRTAGGALINFGDQRLAWMNIIQSKYKYHLRNRSTV